jgi:hypothetical protein
MAAQPVLYSQIIKHLRTTCPVFNNRVGGTAAFERMSAEDANDLTMPYGFVVPLDEVAEPRTNLGEYHHVVERFGIIVALNNTVQRDDGLGMIAMDQLRAIRQQLINALLPWSPVEHYDTFQFIGGRHLTMNRARLWHQYEFSTMYMVGVDNAVENCVPLTAAYRRDGITGFPPPAGYEGFEQWWPEDGQGLPPSDPP